jgi:predicted phosphoribosyltransferase
MWYEPIFKDRYDAGRILAARLSALAHREDVVVLALPRGGVPVAFEVARTLGVPLDVFIVRKLGVPGHEELAFGAIATGGVTVLNDSILKGSRIPKELQDSVIRREEAELIRRERLYRAGRASIDLAGKSVIVVDDGLATGASMAAAVRALQKLGPREIIVGVPVASKQSCDELDTLQNVRCVCVSTPEPFYGVGMWYADFSQTTDEEVQRILSASAGLRPVSKARSSGQ